MTPPVIIRPAQADEAQALSELALASKAHWGYDPAFIESCREALTVTPQDMMDFPHFVAEQAGKVLGFYSLSFAPDSTHLDKLFVSPDAVGQGIGKRLWQHLLEQARATGVPGILIDSDPHAELFYAAMGAERIGLTPSEAIPHRMLPLMRYTF